MGVIDLWVRLDPDGSTVYPVGVDFSNGNQPITIVAVSGKYLVLKVPAGKCWDGIGNPARHVPASFHVYRVTEIKTTDKATSLRLEDLVDVELRAKPKVLDIVNLCRFCQGPSGAKP